MLSAILKLTFITCSLIDARITKLDGQVVSGTLATLDADVVVMSTIEGESTSLPVATVVDITFISATANAPTDASKLLEIVLTDGAVVRAAEVAATAASVSGTSELLGQLDVPRADVRAIRLQELKSEWRAEWNAFLERENDRDILVVLKRDGTGLDFLSGVVSSVGPKEVPFLLDGDEIPVPRPRVFGVVFAKTNSKTSRSNGDLSLRLKDGSRISVSDVAIARGELSCVTSWGSSVILPVDRVAVVDFSQGRVHFLSDLEPISERYFGLDPPDKAWGKLFSQDAATRDGLSRQWKMSRDRFPNSGRPPLSLRSQTYAKGLCIFPKAAIEYALDGKYSRLTAVVGVDDEVAFNQQKGQPPTAVELRIDADGQEVLRRLVKGPDDPFSLDLELKGVTTLIVTVDFGDGNSTCDYLDLADAKLLVDTAKE